MDKRETEQEMLSRIAIDLHKQHYEAMKPMRTLDLIINTTVGIASFFAVKKMIKNEVEKHVSEKEKR